jgi:hypothetical protein
MPVSKHRRKPGGKSVRHPGRGKAPAIPPLPPELQAWRRFRNGYTAPFFAATEGHQDAHDVLDVIAEQAWQYNAPLKVVSKAAVLQEMAEPIEDLHPGRTAEETERALAFLIEQGMGEVEGDQITVPARFQQADKRPQVER